MGGDPDLHGRRGMGTGGVVTHHRDECAGCVIVAGGVIACLLVWGGAVKLVKVVAGWLTN